MCSFPNPRNQISRQQLAMFPSINMLRTNPPQEDIPPASSLSKNQKEAIVFQCLQESEGLCIPHILSSRDTSNKLFKCTLYPNFSLSYHQFRLHILFSEPGICYWCGVLTSDRFDHPFCSKGTLLSANLMTSWNCWLLLSILSPHWGMLLFQKPVHTQRIMLQLSTMWNDWGTFVQGLSPCLICGRSVFLIYSWWTITGMPNHL